MTLRSKSREIAALNDLARQTFMFCRVVLSQGLMSLEDHDLEAVITKVRRFDAFTSDNDPYGEHDFGMVEYKGSKYFWKFDGVDAPSHNGIAMCQTGFVGSQFKRKETSMSEISILAIDLAKHSFQVCATTAEGVVVFNVNAGVKLGHWAVQNWATLGLRGTRAVVGGQSAALSM